MKVKLKTETHSKLNLGFLVELPLPSLHLFSCRLHLFLQTELVRHLRDSYSTNKV
jgi:hypothetical protein